MEDQKKIETCVARIVQGWYFTRIAGGGGKMLSRPLERYSIQISLDFDSFERYYKISIPLMMEGIHKRSTPRMIIEKLRKKISPHSIMEEIRFTEFTISSRKELHDFNGFVLDTIPLQANQLEHLFKDCLLGGANLGVVDINEDPWKTVQVIYTLLQYSSRKPYI